MVYKKYNYLGHSFLADDHNTYEFAELLSDPYLSKLRKVKIVQEKYYNRKSHLPYFIVEYKGERYQAVRNPFRENVLVVNDLRKRNFLKERIRLYDEGKFAMDVKYGIGNW